MATRRKQTWKLDSQNQFARQIGWKLNRNGKRVQHKFRLGSDLKEATRRDERLRELWEQIENTAGSESPLWGEDTLDIAKQIAGGREPISISRIEDESELNYAERVRSLGQRFSSLRIVPSDEIGFARGAGLQTHRMSDVLAWPSSPQQEYEAHLRGRDPEFAPSIPELSVVARPDTDSSASRYALTSDRDDGSTLHQAINAYVTWIETEYYDPHVEDISDNAYTKIRQIRTIMGRHKDVPLAEIDFDEIEQMFRYWRQRPVKKGTTQRMTPKSAKNYIGEMKRFFQWLHRSRRFKWRKPEHFDDIRTAVPRDRTNVKGQLDQVKVFSLDELILLNRYATPIERVLLLLSLNCGFGAAEIAKLMIGDVCLNQAHSKEHQELLNFESTDRDSFIKPIRNKSLVYGEFILFEQTVEAMRWVLGRRLTQPNASPEARLLLNGKNQSFDKLTEGKHRNQQIPNRFDSLVQRVLNDDNKIRSLSFGKLRKTAGDLIRRFSDGEVFGVFMCHGVPVETDDLSDVYSHRPFGKVFNAIRRVEEYLQPVFEAAGPEPFVASPQAYTKRKSIDKIAKMKSEGKSIREIAEAVSKSRSTVHRHLQRLEMAGQSTRH